MYRAALRFGLLVGTITVLALGPAFSDSSSPVTFSSERELTLNEVFTLAFRQNPQILQSLATYRLALLQVDQAYIALNPTLSFTADFLREAEERFGINDSEFQLVFNQPLFSFGKVRWNARAARLSAYQAAEQLRTGIESLFQSVAGDYVQVKLAEQNLVVAQQRYQDRQKYLELSRNLFDAGEIAEYEVVQAESTMLSAQTEILQQQMALSQSQATLLANLGVRPDTAFHLSDLPDPSPPPEDLNEGLKQAMDRRPELSALRWGVASAEAAVKARGLQNTPDLSLIGQINDEYDISNRKLSQSWLLGVQFSWALFDGGLARNQAEQARVLAEQTRQQLAQSERQISLDVVESYVRLTSLWQQIEVSKKALDRAEETNTIAEARFKAGLSSGVELLNAQDGLAGARSTLAQVISEYRLSQIDWNRSISVTYPVELPTDIDVHVELGPEEKDS